MRQVMIALVLGSILLGGLAQAADADGMLLPEVFSPDYMVVQSHLVNVTIEEGTARTRVDQVFVNPHDYPVSTRYLFPVPPDAILSGFEAEVDGQRQAVIYQDAAATNAVLWEQVAQRRDPSLLQYADWESLAFDLTLPAGGSLTMSLSYQEVLVPAGGLYRYHYVLSTERYSSQPLEQVSVTVDLSAAGGLASLYSSSHPVTVERPGAGQARVTWAEQDVRPERDFELYFAPAGDGFGGGLLTGRREGADHFLFLFAPSLEVAPADALPKDLVLVIDRSGSMSGEKIEQARNALHYILGQLNERDRFSIVGFDDRLSIFAPSLRPVEVETLAEARRFVDRLSADGSTDLDAALQAGLSILDDAGESGATPLLVFLTDGLPTAGLTDESLIASRVSQANEAVEARLHVFGVGYDVNTHLLDRLAAENGGTVSYVQPGENLEAALTGFYAKIAQPVLTDLEIAFEGIEPSDLYPERLPDLFQGSSLLLAGRYRATAETVTVRVRGRAAGVTREYVYHYDLDQPARDFVPRLWATRRVGALLDRVRVEGESEALAAEIRQLGLGYGLVTPYTTFAIQAQLDGAASAANMALYADRAGLNAVSGQTTVQARVQNQAYQSADQADLAQGANVVNYGDHSLAQVASQNVDLALLQALPDRALDQPLTDRWIQDNIAVDRVIEFGSADYFELAADPAARPLLQSGANVILRYQGQVIAVQATPHSVSAGQSSVATQPGVDLPALARALLEVMLGFLRALAR